MMSWDEVSLDVFEVEHLEFGHCFLYSYLVNHFAPCLLMVSVVHFMY